MVCVFYVGSGLVLVGCLVVRFVLNCWVVHSFGCLFLFIWLLVCVRCVVIGLVDCSFASSFVCVFV